MAFHPVSCECGDIQLRTPKRLHIGVTTSCPECSRETQSRQSHGPWGTLIFLADWHRAITVILVACGLVGLSSTQARAEWRTKITALACYSPTNLPAAEEADKRHDRLKMD